MYILQEKPDKTATLENGEVFTPITTLKDEYGGVLHIMNDDHCYVFAVKKEEGFRMTPWWNTEAVKVLQILPLPS